MAYSNTHYQNEFLAIPATDETNQAPLPDPEVLQSLHEVFSQNDTVQLGPLLPRLTSNDDQDMLEHSLPTKNENWNFLVSTKIYGAIIPLTCIILQSEPHNAFPTATDFTVPLTPQVQNTSTGSQSYVPRMQQYATQMPVAAEQYLSNPQSYHYLPFVQPIVSAAPQLRPDSNEKDGRVPVRVYV